MLKQQDMTETAKVVFNELNGKPATVGEIAQNTYLSRERCQLILTQLVMAGLADYVKMGGWWVLVAPASHSLMLTGHKRTMAHCFSAKAE